MDQTHDSKLSYISRPLAVNVNPTQELEGGTRLVGETNCKVNI